MYIHIHTYTQIDGFGVTRELPTRFSMAVRMPSRLRVSREQLETLRKRKLKRTTQTFSRPA